MLGWSDTTTGERSRVLRRVSADGLCPITSLTGSLSAAPDAELSINLSEMILSNYDKMKGTSTDPNTQGR